MKLIPEIDRTFEGNYCLIDCCVSLGQLLFRHTVTNPDGTYQNEDLLFMGVDYMELDFSFQDMHISDTDATEDDWRYIASRYGRSIRRPPQGTHRLFRIISGERMYFILGSILKIGENNLPPLQTSIEFKSGA